MVILDQVTLECSVETLLGSVRCSPIEVSELHHPYLPDPEIQLNKKLYIDQFITFRLIDSVHSICKAIV